MIRPTGPEPMAVLAWAILTLSVAYTLWSFWRPER